MTYVCQNWCHIIGREGRDFTDIESGDYMCSRSTENGAAVAQKYLAARYDQYDQMIINMAIPWSFLDHI